MRSLLLFSLPFLLFFTLSSPREASPETAPQVGKPAPLFELPDITGKKIALADFSGKVVLINFWASWCVPCRAGMPSLNKLYETYIERRISNAAVKAKKKADLTA